MLEENKETLNESSNEPTPSGGSGVLALISIAIVAYILYTISTM